MSGVCKSIENVQEFPVVHPSPPGLDSLFMGMSLRWSDFDGGIEVVGEGSDSSDSDFEPNHDSIMCKPKLSRSWFTSLSSSRLFKALTVIFPHLDVCPSDCFSWISYTHGLSIHTFPYHRHSLLIKGSSVGPNSDRIALYLSRGWQSSLPREVLITRQVKGRLMMQVFDFWQLDDSGSTWCHRGTARYIITDGPRF